MIDYSTLDESELIELLTTYTTKYTGYLQFNSDSIAQRECKKVVDEIVEEVCRRKSQTPSRAPRKEGVSTLSFVHNR